MKKVEQPVFTQDFVINGILFRAQAFPGTFQNNRGRTVGINWGRLVFKLGIANGPDMFDLVSNWYTDFNQEHDASLLDDLSVLSTNMSIPHLGADTLKYFRLLHNDMYVYYIENVADTEEA